LVNKLTYNYFIQMRWWEWNFWKYIV